MSAVGPEGGPGDSPLCSAISQIWSIIVLTADLFGWVPDLVDWLGDRFEWVAAVVAWIAAEFGWVGDALAGLGDAAAWLGGLIAALLTWLWETTDPIPGGIRAAIAVTVAGTALALSIRKARLLLLARTSRVQISQLTWAATGKESEAVWITSLFRERLAALETDPLDPLPERAPSAPFVDIVEGVAQGASQNAGLAEAVGRLLRALWPVAAYEVWGTLRPRPDGGGRIWVQLIDRTRGNRTLSSEAVQRGDWERGAEQAAMAVAGALYPRVAGRRRGPWTKWPEAIPMELVGDYHLAQTRERENRFEEAMGAYRAGLARDPMNPHLRLKIATLQERLGLYLDAWVTYRAIVDESKRPAWKGPERRVRLVALYRMAILLSNGRTAGQWVKHDWMKIGDGNLRDDERCKCRRELRIALRHDPLLYKREPYILRRPALATSSGIITTLRSRRLKSEEARKKWVDSIFKPGRCGEAKAERTKREQEIDSVLQVLALRRLEELDAWLRARPPFRLRQRREWVRRRPPTQRLLRRRELARSAVRVSKLLARIRIAGHAERRAGSGRAAIARIRHEHRWLVRRWPFPATNWIRRAVHRLAPRRRWANRRDDAWQLHYNAACTAASVLLKGSVMRSAWEAEEAPPCTASKGQIVNRAVDELEEYAFRAGSGLVAAHADWIAVGDPDLRDLVEREEFELWASHHLPGELPKRRVRGNVDVDRYTTRIVQTGALIFAHCWRTRAEGHPASVKKATLWWPEERSAWRRVGKVFRERRSWEQRLEIIKSFQDWMLMEREPHWIDFSHEPRSDLAEATKIRPTLLQSIAARIGTENASGGGLGETTVMSWAEERVAHVRGAYESGLDPEEERSEVFRAALLWNNLADLLGDELKGKHTGADPPDALSLLESLRDVEERGEGPGLERSGRRGLGRI